MTDETKPVDAPKKCPICCADQIKAGNVGRGEKCPSCKLRHTDACDCELCKVDAPKNDARTWYENLTADELGIDPHDISVFKLRELIPRLLEAYASQFIEQRDAARFAPLGDNHHNAAACPYCNPKLAKAESECAALRQQLQRKLSEVIPDEMWKVYDAGGLARPLSAPESAALWKLLYNIREIAWFFSPNGKK